jgi:hypothetical protein
MQIALKKSSAGGWLGRAVDFCSGGGGYCHAEIICPTLGGEALTSLTAHGACWIRRPHPPEEWTLYEIGHDDRERALQIWAEPELGSGYDFLGDASFIFTPLRWIRKTSGASRSRWFCSEICVDGANAIGEVFPFSVGYKVNPDELAILCQQRGFEKISG